MVNQMDGTEVTEAARPSAPGADTFDLPETPDSLALDSITSTMLEAWGDEPSDEPAADEDDSELDEDDELETEDEEDEEPEAEADLLDDDQSRADEGEPKGKRTVDEWAEVLSRDGVQRHTEIPRKMLGEVLPKFVERERKQVVTDAALITAAQLETQRQWIKWVLNLDIAAQDYPDEKLAWLESGVPEAQAYQQWKSYLEREQAPEQKAQSEQTQRINQSMQRQFERLKDYPELQQELETKHRANPYRPDMDGVDRLTDDVVELLAKGVAQTAAKKQEPAKQKARARVASAENRRAVPRPDVSRGRTSSKTSDDISNITDPDQLFAIGFARANKR